MVPWAHPSLRPKWHVDQFSRLCTAPLRVSRYSTMGRYVFPPKLPFSFRGSGLLSNTWYLGPTRVINPNGITWWMKKKRGLCNKVQRGGWPTHKGPGPPGRLSRLEFDARYVLRKTLPPPLLARLWRRSCAWCKTKTVDDSSVITSDIEWCCRSFGDLKLFQKHMPRKL